jgi:hypothetical protein
MLVLPAFAEQGPATQKTVGQEASTASSKSEPVPLFSAMADGTIEARLIARNSRQARLIVENKTKRPLSIRLPMAFAGTPVLAQLNDVVNPDDAPQDVGVAPLLNGRPNRALQWNPAWPNARPNFPNQGPIFNVPPEKVGNLHLVGVCLEHGKPSPRAAVKYEIKPLGEVTEKPEVAEICSMLGRGEIKQRAAQLAAWHLSNEMSWQQIAGIRHQLGFTSKPVYTSVEISAAKEAVERATEAVKQRAAPADEKSESQNPLAGR